ncbi:O-antigen ligase [Cupriavidus sp. UYPR2.512]|uniref:O-antigen ligase family protein n=1 Tax=Cupriavidus sp. UYPR2.512 TaxID=1080187 RepID=UPI0003A63CCD|nr:O-antigen ligase family protein [Cupriavidus sp. UYPR2.512]UIF90650.1 O-antigen ligase family protein [Cupriavidus necator]
MVAKLITRNMALALYISIAIASDLLGFYYVGTVMIVPLLFAVIITNRGVSKGLIVAIAPLIAILVIGLFRVEPNEAVTFWKDLWAFLRIPAAVVVGYALFSRISGGATELRTIIILPSLVYSYVQLSKFIVDPSLITQTAASIRSVAGNGDVYLALGLIMSLVPVGVVRRGGIRRLSRGLAAAVLFLAMMLSFSRAIVLFSIAVAVFAFWRKRYWKYLIFVSPLVIAGLFFLTSSLGESNSSFTEGSFVEKLARASTEIAISDYDDQQNINLNWRGYESYMALKHFLDGNFANYAFGYGFGELVDVGIYMKLGGEDLRYVPYFHNGYLYLLIKTGIVGLLLYLIFIGGLFSRLGKAQRNWPREHPVHFFTGLAKGALIGTLFMTYIISGLFNKADGLAISLLLGAILAVSRSVPLPSRPQLVKRHFAMRGGIKSH